MILYTSNICLPLFNNKSKISMLAFVLFKSKPAENLVFITLINALESSEGKPELSVQCWAERAVLSVGLNLTCWLCFMNHSEFFLEKLSSTFLYRIHVRISLIRNTRTFYRKFDKIISNKSAMVHQDFTVQIIGIHPKNSQGTQSWNYWLLGLQYNVQLKLIMGW